MRRIALSVVALMLSYGVALADPVGIYTLEGTNPGGQGKYTGDVAVVKTGETYKVVWHVGGATYVGTGIGDKDFIAVSYKSGDDSGVALYGREADGSWSGVWAYAGAKQIGVPEK
jgi:hypothetical protein